MHAVIARQHHQSLVDLVGNVHEKCQQWMAIDIIFRVPLRNCRIGKWVKTSYMEGLDKELVVVFRELGKLVVVLDDGQRIEDDGNEQRYNGRPFFISLDAENIEYFFHE